MQTGSILPEGLHLPPLGPLLAHKRYDVVAMSRLSGKCDDGIYGRNAGA